MGKRRLAREYCLQVLYLTDVGRLEASAAGTYLNTMVCDDEDTIAFAREIALGALGNKEHLHSLIAKHAKNWKLSRMSAVDRSILTLAAYEIISTQSPIAVIIDEAIELSKSYSTEESGRFINGVLDKIKVERQ